MRLPQYGGMYVSVTYQSIREVPFGSPEVLVYASVDLALVSAYVVSVAWIEVGHWAARLEDSV